MSVWAPTFAGMAERVDNELPRNGPPCTHRYASVCHVGVNAAAPVPGGPRPRTPSDCFCKNSNHVRVRRMAGTLQPLNDG